MVGLIPIPHQLNRCVNRQQAGSEGQGTSTHTFAEKNAIRNHGTGEGEGKDQPFPEAEAGE